RIGDVVARPSCNRKQHAAIVVANMRQTSAIIGEQARGRGEARDWFLEVHRGGVLSCAGDDEREEIKVEGVAMVVRGSLGMAAVRRELTIQLRPQYLAANRGPTCAGGELG